MEAEKEKVCEGAEYAFITDIRITLECLHEAYQMEGDLIKSVCNNDLPIHPYDQGTMQYNGIV